MREPIETLLFDFGGTLDANGVAWKDPFYALYRAEGLDMAADAFESSFFAADDSLVGSLAPATDHTQDYSTDNALLNRPLQRLAPVFHAADLVMVNCEGALSDHGRQVGLNRTPERFALSMRSAGIDLVNLANNHTFDAEERGFLDTLRTLSLAGIAHVGGGMDLADARKPVIVERNGVKLGFLGYTQFNNIGESAFAAAGRPGIVPMDPFLMKEDIRKLRSQVDYVLVAIHWATSRSAEVFIVRRTPTLPLRSRGKASPSEQDCYWLCHVRAIRKPGNSH